MNWLFDIDNTLFTLWDYQMSAVELIGTILNVLCVLFLVRRNMINWAIGILATVFFGVMFYQLRLYADLAEQIYFLVTGVVGWFMWANNKRDQNMTRPSLNRAGDGYKLNIQVRQLTKEERALVVVVLLPCTAGLYTIITHLDDWFPRQFPEEASYPWIDTATTVASFIAQFLMMKRFWENWVLWIAVDVVGIWLYWQKEVPFISALYVLFLILASKGLYDWVKQYRAQNDVGTNPDWSSAEDLMERHSLSSWEA